MRQLLIACLLLLAGSVVAGARAEELQRSVTVSAQSEIVVKPFELRKPRAETDAPSRRSYAKVNAYIGA